MASANFKVEFPRRQAMLSIYEDVQPWQNVPFPECWKPKEIDRVPVFVWPMPTFDGLFIVENQDGTVQRVRPDSLTFLGSKELFDQYDWSEKRSGGNAASREVKVPESKLVYHMANMSGRPYAHIAHEMGKSKSYISQSVRSGSSPTAASLAKLAKACDYRLVLEGHGESITIVDKD